MSAHSNGFSTELFILIINLFRYFITFRNINQEGVGYVLLKEQTAPLLHHNTSSLIIFLLEHNMKSKRLNG